MTGHKLGANQHTMANGRDAIGVVILADCRMKNDFLNSAANVGAVCSIYGRRTLDNVIRCLQIRVQMGVRLEDV